MATRHGSLVIGAFYFRKKIQSYFAKPGLLGGALAVDALDGLAGGAVAAAHAARVLLRVRVHFPVAAHFVAHTWKQLLIVITITG